MKLSQELASMVRQLRSLMLSKIQFSPPDQNSIYGVSLRKRAQGSRRSAFSAVPTEDGAVVVLVLQDTIGAWPQKEYGYFETWTQAQEFAGMLNDRFGLDPVEARHIVVSAILAAANSEKPN
jgi:hypothetical protein